MGAQPPWPVRSGFFPQPPKAIHHKTALGFEQFNPGVIEGQQLLPNRVVLIGFVGINRGFSLIKKLKPDVRFNSIERCVFVVEVRFSNFQFLGKLENRSGLFSVFKYVFSVGFTDFFERFHIYWERRVQRKSLALFCQKGALYSYFIVNFGLYSFLPFFV